MTRTSKHNNDPYLRDVFGLGDKLRALREERALTLKKMSTACGLSLTYLSEIERGTVCPSLETIKQLAKLFNVPVSMLLKSRQASGLPSKLQYIRKLQNLSQKDLAAKAGVSPGLIAQLELGKVNASLKTLRKLAEALNVSVCYLILDHQEVDEFSAGISPALRSMFKDPKVQAVLGSIGTLDEVQLKLIMSLIRTVKNPVID